MGEEGVTDRLGDVDRLAYGIAQNITPVPGGTGPMEMAVLAERYIQKEYDPNLQPWQLEDYYVLRTFSREEVRQLQQQWAQEIFPTAAQQFDISFDRNNPVRPGVYQVTTEQGYRLILDRNERSFAIQGSGRRGDLAKFQFEGQELSLVPADGLAGSDMPKFREMQQSVSIGRSPQFRSASDYLEL
jgi:hypothetical protein